MPKDNMGWSGWEEFRNLTPNDKTNLHGRGQTADWNSSCEHGLAAAASSTESKRGGGRMNLRFDPFRNRNGQRRFALLPPVYPRSVKYKRGGKKQILERQGEVLLLRG